MVVQIFSFISNAFSWAAAYFVIILEKTGMTGIYLSAFFIMLLCKFIIGPIFGSAVYSGASDTVKGIKERNRSKGHFERNQRGKYSK